MELLVGPELFAQLYDADRVAEHIVEFSLGGIATVETPSGWKA
jgi:hypothetical protein